MSNVVITASGGVDSSTLCYLLRYSGDLHILTFDYGQRHRKEIECAKKIASNLKARHDIIDLRSVGALLGGSALTDNIEVPDGHYAEDVMKVTVVPNRNAIMLAVAFGVAVAEGAELVAIGVHAGDHFIYPDCRPDFVKAFDTMERLAVKGFGHINLHIFAPFLNMTKADIVRKGVHLGVPYGDTWSCYKGREVACGRCGTCCERLEAFAMAGFEDPIEYADREYWKEQVRLK